MRESNEVPMRSSAGGIGASGTTGPTADSDGRVDAKPFGEVGNDSPRPGDPPYVPPLSDTPPGGVAITAGESREEPDGDWKGPESSGLTNSGSIALDIVSAATR
ncbi:hypothetical protein [Streptomyces radicis]|uniref:hypothetical protein n=1 Tax=Streptomyces radicis TaxID=1750517 RepID=UPI0011C4606F|nr:hypothetical protein [Streptomyces radicis]